MGRAKRKKTNKKIKIKMLRLNQIFFLVVITTIIVSILSFARYRTTISGENVASIAVPVITLSDNVLELENLRPNTNFEYDFYVTTKYDGKVSDVTMEYDLELIKYSNIPLKVQLYKRDDEQNTLQECVLNDENRTEKRIISFGENDGQTHNYKITIMWDGTDNDYRYNLETEYIEIKLNSTQIN